MKKTLLFVFLGLSLLSTDFVSAANCETNNRDLIFKHDSIDGNFFVDKADALSSNIASDPYDVATKKFSKLSTLESYRDTEGKFEFKLSYPRLAINPINRRKQTSNPTTDAIAGYEPINIMSTSQNRGGLEYNAGSQSLINGSVGITNWFYGIGSIYTHGGPITFPGPNGPVNLVELYVCNPYPKATIAYSETLATNQDVIATVSLTEGNGVTNCQVTNNSSNTNYTFTDNGTFLFEYSCENAGNTFTGNKLATVSNIDKIAPTATIKYGFTLPTSGSVLATLTGLSELGITITNNNGSDGFLFTQSGSFTFEYKDAAGNVGYTTATVTNIRPEYPIQSSYYPALKVLPSEIDQRTRTYDGSNKSCIYRALDVDMGSGTSAIIPAWTCREGYTGIADRNLSITDLAKESATTYSFFLGRSDVDVIFSKPVKVQFTSDKFAGGSYQRIYYKSNFLDKRQVSNTYYTVCNAAGESSIQNNVLSVFEGNYIGYICKGGGFEIQFSPESQPINNINNSTSSSSSNSNSNYVENSYNETTNNYYNDTGLAKELLSGMAELLAERDAKLFQNVLPKSEPKTETKQTTLTSDNVQQTFKVDNVDMIDGTKLEEDVMNQAKLMGLRVNREVLSAYIYGRKKGILTNKYYDEKDLLDRIDRGLVAVMFNRFGESVLHLTPQSYNCNFTDIDSLSFNTQQHILSACKFGFMGYKSQTEGVLGSFRPYSFLVRSELINIAARTLKIDEQNKALVEYVLKDQGVISNFTERSENKFTILKTMQNLESKFDKIDAKYIQNLEKKYPTPEARTSFLPKKTTDTVAVQPKKEVPTTTAPSSKYTVKFTFTQPYKLGTKGAGISNLQQFLQQYGTYKGDDDGYFGETTLEALYQFQLKEGLLTEDSAEYLRGYMGPSTRDRINALIK